MSDGHTDAMRYGPPSLSVVKFVHATETKAKTAEKIIRRRRAWMVYQPIAGADFISFNRDSAQSWAYKYGERGYKIKPVTVTWTDAGRKRPK